MLYAYKEKFPVLKEGVWIAPNSVLIGDVVLEKDVNVWFSCVIRGDVHSIRIGKNCNIQDMSMLHVTSNKFSLTMGDNCTLGHRVTLHGCTLEDYSFVGIGATVLDGCVLGEFSMIGAGSLVPPGKKIPPRCLALGVPAQVKREITQKEENLIKNTVEHYKTLKNYYILNLA